MEKFNMPTGPQVKSAEQNEAEAYKAKLEKVESEMGNLPAYRGQLADLNEQKADIENALATEGSPEIDAQRDNLKEFLAELETSIAPLQHKVSFLTTIESFRNEQAWCDVATQKVDEIVKEIGTTLKDDQLLTKSGFYDTWGQTSSEYAAQNGKGSFSVQDHFPYFVRGSVNFVNKYPDQMFKAGKNVEVGKAYKWKDAMDLTKKYYADRKDEFGKAVETRIKETALI